MEVIRVIFLFLCSSLMVSAQSPGIGNCEKYIPMPDFDFSRYLGVWYEIERSWTLFEAGSKCVRSNYTQTSDGKIHVQNEQTNRLTSIKRVIEGEMKQAGKAAEGKINIKYSIPIPLDATYNILKTDYDTYSVVHYCRSVGPFNAQFAWIMSRERQPPGPVIQSAYGVLDEFGIPRNFFVKTDQKECDIGPAVPDIVPSNPEVTTGTEVRTPSKEMLPPEPSDTNNQFIQSDPNPQDSSIKITEESTLEEKPAEIIPEPVKEVEKNV